MVRAPATSDPTMTERPSPAQRPTAVEGLGDPHARAIRLWLYAVAALVLAMVLVGGATRLTESGLSITEWKPVMGVMPPLSEHAWQAEFEKYQAIPQYRAMNSGMDLDQFKTIYWWEWTHRLFGRVIGAAYLLPFLFFLWRGFVAPALRPWLWLIFGLGALQGAVGWWMVASGLADRVEVSQYRLATHLLLACLIYVALVLTAWRMGQRERALVPGRVRAGALGLLILVLAQIYLGALVAGLRAGYAYNTWPLIDGAFAPDPVRLFFIAPLWRNFFENILTVQFDHRMLAYVIFVVALWHAIDVVRKTKQHSQRVGALVLFTAVVLQMALGIATLLLVVPLPLALGHQAMAMLVLTAATVHAANLGRRASLALIPAQARIQSGSPLSRGRPGQVL
jgi:cytochrome c oxidase assembly protein subunit 15